jgi:hypothetical protein
MPSLISILASMALSPVARTRKRVFFAVSIGLCTPIATACARASAVLVTQVLITQVLKHDEQRICNSSVFCLSPCGADWGVCVNKRTYFFYECMPVCTLVQHRPPQPAPRPAAATNATHHNRRPISTQRLDLAVDPVADGNDRGSALSGSFHAVFVRLPLGLAPAGGPFLPMLSVRIHSSSLLGSVFAHWRPVNTPLGISLWIFCKAPTQAGDVGRSPVFRQYTFLW